MKSSWIGIGFSHQRVPSLSDVAMRDEVRPSLLGDGAHEVQDRLLAPAVDPAPSTSSFAIARPLAGHPMAISGC